MKTYLIPWAPLPLPEGNGSTFNCLEGFFCSIENIHIGLQKNQVGSSHGVIIYIRPSPISFASMCMESAFLSRSTLLSSPLSPPNLRWCGADLNPENRIPTQQRTCSPIDWSYSTRDSLASRSADNILISRHIVLPIWVMKADIERIRIRSPSSCRCACVLLLTIRWYDLAFQVFGVGLLSLR